MPFVSRQQERWAFANHMDFARRWAAMTNQKALPTRKKKKRKT